MVELFGLYSKTIAPLKEPFPEIYGSAMNCVLADPSLKSNIRTILKFLQWIYASLRSSKEVLPKFDVLLFNSSNKTSFGPAIDELSMRLTKQGYRCAVLSYDSIAFIDSDGKYLRNSITLFNRSGGLLNAFRSILRGALALSNILIATRGENKIFRHILMRLLPCWFELSASYSRSVKAPNFLLSLGVRLVITHNEKIPIANELVMAASKLNISTVLFLCVHPDVMTQPIISRDVWVWNNSIADSLSKEINEFTGLSDKKIHIVGHYESDYIAMLSKLPSKNEFLPNLDSNKKIFVFISEYVSNKTWMRGPITERCIDWIRIAAVELPDWVFVIKTRPYQKVLIPGFDPLDSDQPSNLILYQGAMSLAEILASRKVSAAGALGSLGLFAAALSGTPSFRFIASKPNMQMPFLDQYSTVIRAPIDLIRALRQLEIHQSELRIKIDNIPFRGNSISRMEELALNYLQ